MKKNRLSLHYIDEPVFRSGISIIANCDIAALNQWIRKYCASDTELFDPKEDANTRRVGPAFDAGLNFPAAHPSRSL